VKRDGAVAALYEAAVAAQNDADYLSLAQHAQEMVALCETNGDRLGLAWGHYFAGAANYQRSNGSAAVRAYQKARDLFAELENREGVARSMLGLAAVALDIDLDVTQARHLYDLAVPIVRQLGDKRRLGIVLGNLGEICRMEGNTGRALRYAAESIELLREAGERAYVGWQLTSSGHYHLLRRENDEAIACMRAAQAELWSDPAPRWIAWYFDIWFIIAAELDRWELAARVLGFVNRYRDEHNCPRMPGILPWFSEPVERLAAHVDADRLHDLMLESEVLTLDQAQALVEGVSLGSPLRGGSE